MVFDTNHVLKNAKNVMYSFRYIAKNKLLCQKKILCFERFTLGNIYEQPGYLRGRVYRGVYHQPDWVVDRNISTPG